MKKTIALVIMDGFGNSDTTQGNAIRSAETPNIDKFQKTYPTTFLNASGRAVGLPDGQMGNSEVGHLNLGAGRVVDQDITMIDKSIESGEFFKNDILKNAMEGVSENNALHLIGLTSNGGVHSSINHLFALLEMAKKKNVKKVFIHIIADGRDVPPTSGVSFVKMIEEKIVSIGLGKIATIVGRYYYMDRDKRWDRVEKGYNCVFNGVGTRVASAENGMQNSYKNGVTDEFLEPMIVGEYNGVKNGDSIIFYNFRSDRAREISHAVLDDKFDNFARIKKDIYYVGMTEYDEKLKNIHTAFPPKDIKNTLGEYLANNDFSQLRIAETEKYAHVTFFFNGGIEEPNKLETRELIPSPKVATYDLQPEMSAFEVTKIAINDIGKYDVIILNYANCDMVGHTGIMNATIKAVETVDTCVGKFVEQILKVGGVTLLTADHGNAEMMTFADGSPCTSHTTNLVPFSVIGDDYIGCALKDNMALCDVAPTMLEILGLPQPIEMTGTSILKH